MSTKKILRKKDKHDKKQKPKQWLNPNNYGVYLHIIADTLGSVGVITSSIIIHYTGWVTADPICSFFMSVLIFISVIPLLKSSASTLLQFLPEERQKKINKAVPKITQLEGVVAVGNLHFWTYSRDSIVGTIHVQISEGGSEQKILRNVQEILFHAGIKNVTVQLTY